MTYPADSRTKIIEGLSEGKSLRAICGKDGLPSWRTVLRWQVEDEDFGSRCARAREAGAEAELEKMRGMERKVLLGTINPQAANVVLSNMRWRMEKLKPRAFGQKLEIEHGGSIRTLTDEQLAQKVAEYAARVTGEPEAQ